MPPSSAAKKMMMECWKRDVSSADLQVCTPTETGKLTSSMQRSGWTSASKEWVGFGRCSAALTRKDLPVAESAASAVTMASTGHRGVVTSQSRSRRAGGSRDCTRRGLVEPGSPTRSPEAAEDRASGNSFFSQLFRLHNLKPENGSGY